MANKLIVMDTPQQDTDGNYVDTSTIISTMEGLSVDGITKKSYGTSYYYHGGLWTGTYFTYTWLVDATKLTDVSSAVTTFTGSATWSSGWVPAYVALSVG